MTLKPFKSLLDSWHEVGNAVVIWGVGDRKDVASFVKMNYGEELVDALKLFHLRQEGAVGWLAFTRSRVIFLVQQDMNHYDSSSKIIWIIDDIKNTNFTIKQSDTYSNEIEIASGKSILFDSEIISSARLISEIKKYFEPDKPQNNDVTKTQEKHIVHQVQNKPDHVKRPKLEQLDKIARLITQQEFQDIDSSSFRKAYSIKEEAKRYLQNGDYDMSVRRSQESFEQYLKSIFYFLSQTFTKVHDIGKEIYVIQKILNDYGIDKKKIARMVKECNTLANWRELAFYGDEKLRVSDIFRKEEAELALTYVQDMELNCNIVKSEIIKQIIK